MHTDSSPTNYLGLARKWRPQIFSDLLGQSHVTKTLANAIKASRVGHGYLFTGTRGVGKTSSARIFAKSIRCVQAKETAIPCNVCADCVEISEGRSLDVQEIDGASNNGVDAVRELRENAKFLPNRGQYKIYIIDEVHMLTTAAFNALLKTLEEPPPHLIFILATTDPQKIPATVLSRCQKFDFRRVSLADLTKRLKEICQAEGAQIENSSALLLAEEADGSLRDGLSLLDQVLATGCKEIDLKLVNEALGLIDRRSIFTVLEGILNKNPAQALEAFSEVYHFGADLKKFIREILKKLRALMIVQIMSDNKSDISQLLDISETDINDLKPFLGLRTQGELDLLFSILDFGLEDVGRSLIPKILLDVLILKLCSTEELIPLKDFQRPVDAPTILAPPPSAPRASVTQPAPSSTPPAAPAHKTNIIDKALWPQFVKHACSMNAYLGGLLENASFESFQNQVLLLGFTKDKSFYCDQLKTPKNNGELLLLLKNYLGSAARLEYKEVLLSSSVEDQARLEREMLLKKKQKAVLESEAMRAAKEVLGARIERLEIRE